MKRAFAASIFWAALLFAGESRAAGPEGGKLLATIRFDRGTEIGLASQRALLDAAKELEGKANLALFLIGHTDERGDAAMNVVLGKRRAEVIETWLKEHGVVAEDLKVVSRGEEDLLERGTTPEINALNRRVEIWVAERTAKIDEGPLAWVSWIHRDVTARKPDVFEWTPARLRLPLERAWRVRAAMRSAGEVTFRSNDQLYVGEDSLVVIFGQEMKSAKQSAEIADVKLEEGSLFARLAGGKEAPPVKVDTPGSRVALKTKDARVAHNKRKRASTVSVYEGSATVSAQSQSVEVGAGFGTRVKTGSAPEPATPLPPPPSWTANDPLTMFAGDQLELAWRFADSSTVAILEVLDAKDRGAAARPIATINASGGSVRLGELAAGEYDLRVRAVSDRELVGVPSATRTLAVVVRPPPEPPKEVAEEAPRPPPPPPVDTRTLLYMVHVFGGGQLDSHGELSPFAALWLGLSIKLSEGLWLDIGPYLARYRAEVASSAVPSSGFNADVFPLALRAAAGFDLGFARPYFGASAGAQIASLDHAATNVGLEVNRVQPSWNLFGGAGLALGPGRLSFELGFGLVGLGGERVSDEIGGITVLAGYGLFQ